MNRSMPGLPVHHQLPEFTQTHVHRVGDAIQPSHPLSSPSPSAPKSLPASGSFPMSQLFAWSGQSIGVSASVLPMNTQDWSPSGWTGWGQGKVWVNLELGMNTHTTVYKIDNHRDSTPYSVITHMGKNLKKAEYMYVYNWLTLLSTWNSHNIVKQLYSNKIKK